MKYWLPNLGHNNIIATIDDKELVIKNVVPTHSMVKT